MERKLYKKIWISSLASVLLLITPPSPEGHWTDAFTTRVFVNFDYDYKEVVMEKNLKDPRSFGFDSGAYGFREEHPGFEHYINIFESEIRFIGGQAARWGNIETGGELYGLFTHAGRFVIMLATPSGPGAFHEVAKFTQDIDFLKKNNIFLRNNFGVLYLGSDHSHHILNIKGPSNGDIRSTNSIAKKNGYQRLVQLILTFEKDRSSSFNFRSNKVYEEGATDVVSEPRNEKDGLKGLYEAVKARFTPSHRFNFIRIHSFIYLDAACGQPVRCPIRIIPGTSPIRRAILRNSSIPGLAIPYTFPMDRILFDSFTLSDEPSDQAFELPTRISNQWLQLPKNVREGSRVIFKNGLIVLSLPLPLINGMIFVAYSDKPMHNGVEAVFFRQNGKATKPIEVSKEALCSGPHTGLTMIYRRVANLVAGERLAVRPANSSTSEERGKSQEDNSKEREVTNDKEESNRIRNEEGL